MLKESNVKHKCHVQKMQISKKCKITFITFPKTMANMTGINTATKEIPITSPQVAEVILAIENVMPSTCTEHDRLSTL